MLDIEGSPPSCPPGQAPARAATFAALAAPLQHEVNNLLTVVFANLETLRRTEREPAAQRQLDRIAQAGRRLETGVGAYLASARRTPGAQVFDPGAVLEALLPLLRLPLAAAGVALDAAVAGGLPPVRADRAGMELDLLTLALAAARLPRGDRVVLDLRADPAGGARLTARVPAADFAPPGPGFEAAPASGPGSGSGSGSGSGEELVTVLRMRLPPA